MPAGFFCSRKLEVAIWKKCDKIYSLSIKETAVEKKEILLKLRQETGMNRREFAEYFGIPYRTVQEWELGHREMPGYLLRLMYYHEKTKEKILTDREKNSDTFSYIGAYLYTDRTIRICSRFRRAVGFGIVERRCSD